MMKSMQGSAGLAVAAAILFSAGAALAQDPKVAIPDVTVTAPATPLTVPPYLQNPGQGGSLRNPVFGRYRNEEDKFVQQPCGTTRLSSAIAGGTCLVGYRLDAGQMRTTNSCDTGLDVVMYNAGNVAVEADILSFDPQKVTAVGAVKCRLIPYKYYAEVDFQDMNKVTRRGSNFHNLADPNDLERSIEFYDGNKPCVAMRRLGPPWNGGNVWIMHVSICRTDAGAVSAQNISETTTALLVRIYDPVGNLRSAPAQLYSPSDSTSAVVR